MEQQEQNQTPAPQTESLPETQPEQPKKEGLLADILDIAEAVITSVFVVLLLFTFVLRPITVDGYSMESTLFTTDRVLMWSMFYTPDQGDIVIIDGSMAHLFTDEAQTEVYETNGIGLRLIKRVIATPGETVDIDFETGEVSVDGEVLSEPYINAVTQRNDGAFTYPLTVPEGYYFVMGDNRNKSADSRNPQVGLIKESTVLGRAVCRFYRDPQLCDSFGDRFDWLAS